MKKSIFLGLGALLALGFTSCSQDDLGINVTKPLESDQTFYTNISVRSTDAQTRAGDPDFDKGKDYENAVKSIYFIFYDEDHQRVATAQVMRNINSQASVDGNSGEFESQGEIYNPKPEESTYVPSENSVYEGVVQVNVKQGMKTPACVMCFVNPITKTNFEINPDFATLETLERAERESIIDQDNYFAMSKSVYYGDDPVSGNSDWKIIATPIKCVIKDDKIDESALGNQLFTSYEAAKDALQKDNNKRNQTSSVVDIYVERYAAKVSLDVQDVESKTLTMKHGDATENLEFVPEYWAVNAYENSTYATKSFLSDDFSRDLTYAEINQALSSDGSGTNVWYWNSKDNHRSYWAQSPAYYASRYPRNADDILDRMPEAFGVAEEYDNIYENVYPLGYYSFDYIKSHATHKLADKAREIGKEPTYPAIYVRENTVQGRALREAASDPMASAKAAIGSVVLCGRYKVGGDFVDPNTTIYVMGNATNGYQLFKNQDEMVDYFINSSISLAIDEKGTPFFNYSNTDYGFNDAYKAYRNLFKVVHPSESVRKDYDNMKEEDEVPEELLVLDSRFVTLQVDGDKLEETPLYAYIDNKYQKVTKQNLSKINRQILYACGMVQGYKGGLAYFSIPIKHLGFYRQGNANYYMDEANGLMNLNPGDKEFDWSKVRTGDFGIVRNHSYTIRVSQIAGLGNGIPDPGEPIVPPTDPEEYYIGGRLIILNWAVVPVQDVKL